jgi:anti-sigma regulatory factor (Ser/Thr protein kinase)
MARAGHPPPAIVDPQGRVTFPDLPAGTPLGIGLGVPFESVELELPEGSLLALYTDGLVETRDHDIDAGMHRLGTALAQPGLSLEDLCSRAMETVPGQAPSDDVTLLLVRPRSLSPTQVASWTLPCDETAVRSARNMAAGQLAAWGLDSLEESTKLIVSELVTNAVRHSTGPIGLRLIQHQVLTCEVFDNSGSTPRLRRAQTTDENGRGLFLVAQLSRRWGCRPVSDGKVVWSDQDLAPSPNDRKPRPGMSWDGQVNDLTLYPDHVDKLRFGRIARGRQWIEAITGTLKRVTKPNTVRRPHADRNVRPERPAHVRPDRGDLPHQDHQREGQTLDDRLLSRDSDDRRGVRRLTRMRDEVSIRRGMQVLQRFLC